MPTRGWPSTVGLGARSDAFRCRLSPSRPSLSKPGRQPALAAGRHVCVAAQSLLGVRCALSAVGYDGRGHATGMSV